MRVHSDHERVSIEIETAMAGGRICATVVMPRAGIFCMPAFVYSEAVSRSVILKLHSEAAHNFCHLNDRHLVASCETAPPAELFLSLVLDECCGTLGVSLLLGGAPREKRGQFLISPLLFIMTGWVLSD